MQRRRITIPVAVLVFFGVASNFYFVDVEPISGDGIDVVGQRNKAGHFSAVGAHYPPSHDALLRHDQRVLRPGRPFHVLVRLTAEVPNVGVAEAERIND